MSQRPKYYQSNRTKKKRDNASKGRKGKRPSVDDPPAGDPSVDDPPVDGTQTDTTQTESSLSTGTVQPSGDPTGSSGDLANDIVPADNMPIHSDQEPGQSLHDAGVKGSGSTVQGASAGGNMSGNGTRPKTPEQVPSTTEALLQSDLGDGEDFTATILRTEDAIDTDSETDIDPTDADVEEDCISRTEQEAAAGGQMSGNGTRPNEKAGRSFTGPGPPAVAVQPTNDPTGASGDLANGIDATDDMPIHSDQKPEQTVQDADVKVSESTVKVASAAGNMSGNGTRPKRPSPVPSASAAGSSTSPPVEPVDRKKYDSYIDIGFCVNIMDNVTMLLVKMLAHSIYTSKNAEKNLKKLIETWQKNHIKVPYAKHWSPTLNAIHGGRCNSQIDEIFLDVFGVAYNSFFMSDASRGLKYNLPRLIEDAYKKDGDKTRLHTVQGVAVHINVMKNFLKGDIVARDRFFWGLIVEIIRTAEWTVSTLKSETENWQNCGASSDVRSRYELVQAMIDIRNDVIHEDCQFSNLGKELDFTRDYKSFIDKIPHNDIHPARAPAAEEVKLEQPLKDVAQFKKFPEDLKKLRVVNKQQVVQLKAKDDEITKLNREIETQDAALAGSGRAVTELMQTITRHEQTITGQQQTITRHEQTITRHEQTITEQQQAITGQQQTITGQQQIITTLEQTIADMRREIERLQRREDD